jgi:hypothetical protein
MWIRRNVEEPQIWLDTPKADRGRSACCSRRGSPKVTLFVTLMNACTLFGWWGLNSWVPSYLALGPDRGGIGLSSSVMSLFVILMQTGMWLGYVSFGYIADAIGRKKTYVTFVLAPACCCRSTASSKRQPCSWRSVRSSPFSVPATTAVSAR